MRSEEEESLGVARARIGSEGEGVKERRFSSQNGGARFFIRG